MKNQDDKEDSNGYTPLLNESTLQDDEDELEQVLIQKAEKGTKSLSGITKKIHMRLLGYSQRFSLLGFIQLSRYK